jgi:hypothetical protein
MANKVRKTSKIFENLYQDGFALLASALAGITGILIGLKWFQMDDTVVVGILLGSISALSINEFKKKWGRRKHEEQIANIEKSLSEIKENTSGKMEEMLKMLGGKFGQGVTEEEMLNFYDKLKNNATEFHVVWCLKFEEGEKRINEYLKKEKKLIQAHGLTVRRLIHEEVNVRDKLVKYGEEFANENRYHQRFGYGYRNMEIGYSYYENTLKNGQRTARGLIILADNLMRPKVGFYFDAGINEDHKNITDTIEHMFNTEWNRCKDILKPS